MHCSSQLIFFPLRHCPAPEVAIFEFLELVGCRWEEMEPERRQLAIRTRESVDEFNELIDSLIAGWEELCEFVAMLVEMFVEFQEQLTAIENRFEQFANRIERMM